MNPEEKDGPPPRVVNLCLVAGAILALGSIPIAAATGGPYLTASTVNGWVVVFAIGLLSVLFAAPFALELSLRGRYPDRDKRWEISLLLWGAAALIGLVLSYAIGTGSGFSGEHLSGTIGLLGGLESGIGVVTVVVWLFSN